VTSALFVVTLAVSVAGVPALAQTLYKRVDEQGRVTYSSEPIAGGKPMVLEPLTTIRAPVAEPAAAPHARVESLARELAAERDQLALARQALELEKQRPGVVRTSGGPEQAGSRYEDKLGTLTERVESQERRVAELERELAALAARPAAGEAKR
jgi:hypothetical protein